MSENTLNLVIRSIVIVVIAFGLIVHDACIRVPLRMANQGFCWQTVIVPGQVGISGTSYTAYAPCKGKDVAPVEASK